MIRTRAEHDATAMASAEERLPSDSRDHCVQTHVVADSCVESSPSPQKKRLRQRDQIVALRKEISALNQQLQELNDGQLLQDTLDRLLDGSGVRTNWKQVAKRERRAVELAMETKTELNRQAAANLYLLKHVKRMFLAQRKSVLLSRMSTRCISFQPEREDSQVFLGLKARLDRRTSQLDEVLAQCVASVATCERRKFCALDDGQRMELRTIEVKPFAFMAVGETIYQQRQKDVQFKSLGENEVYIMRNARSQLHCDNEPNEMRGRSAMRRIVLNQQIILLWEMVSEWDDHQQQDQSEPQPWMSQQGWMVISPLKELGEGVSLMQSGISMQFFTREGYVLSTRGPQASSAMRLLQSLGNHQEKVTENTLIDAKRS